jgi:hypothetical protein
LCFLFNTFTAMFVLAEIYCLCEEILLLYRKTRICIDIHQSYTLFKILIVCCKIWCNSLK